VVVLVVNGEIEVVVAVALVDFVHLLEHQVAGQAQNHESV
jgi:hypothetical protein